MISMRSSFRWWRENRWTEESALRAEGNSWWYLKGSRVRLTSGLLAPRHLDLMNAADRIECNPSRLHFHRSWRSERFMTANARVQRGRVRHSDANKKCASWPSLQRLVRCG